MSLIDDLATAQEAMQPTCKVCVLLTEQEKHEADALRNALSSKLGSAQICNILQRNGIDIGRPSVLTHRREAHQ